MLSSRRYHVAIFFINTKLLKIIYTVLHDNTITHIKYDCHGRHYLRWVGGYRRKGRFDVMCGNMNMDMTPKVHLGLALE